MKIQVNPPTDETKSLLWGYTTWSETSSYNCIITRKFIPSNFLSLHILLTGKVKFEGQTIYPGVPFLIFPSDKPIFLGFKVMTKGISLFFVPMALSLEFNRQETGIFPPCNLRTRFLLDRLKNELHSDSNIKIIPKYVHDLLYELFLMFNKPYLINSHRYNYSKILYAGNFSDKARFYFCERHFRRKFKLFFGLTPVKYFRILRLQQLLRLKKEKVLSISELVALCGYYDNAHLTHEFKYFTGLSPREYFKATDHYMDLFLPYVHFGAPNEPDLFLSEAKNRRLEYSG